MDLRHALRKKVEPKRLHPGAVLENMARGGVTYHETAPGVEPFWLHFFSQCGSSSETARSHKRQSSDQDKLALQ